WTLFVLLLPLRLAQVYGPLPFDPLFELSLLGLRGLLLLFPLADDRFDRGFEFGARYVELFGTCFDVQFPFARWAISARQILRNGKRTPGTLLGRDDFRRQLSKFDYGLLVVVAAHDHGTPVEVELAVIQSLLPALVVRQVTFLRRSRLLSALRNHRGFP